MISDSSIIDVALAVIVDPTGNNVLISRRHDDAHLGGLWEFPGGKIEPGESAAEAAVRESLEEVDLAVVVLRELTIVRVAYADRTVRLNPFLCRASVTNAVARASQEVRWTSTDSLWEFEFPHVNASIIAELGWK